MTLLNTLKSRKALAGMVAVATGTATVAAPVVALPLSAAPGGDATGSPAVNGADAGTYESCSALFGLTSKEDANYVTFNVGGTADPLPAIGVGLTPVITVTESESGDVDECEPEIGFDDEASWYEYLGFVELEADAPTIVPYPGPGYLVPKTTADNPLSLALRVEADSSVDPNFTVTWEPSELTFLVIEELDELALGMIFFEMVVEELGGPTSALGTRFSEIFSETPDPECVDDPPDDPPAQIDVELAAALINLTGVPVSFFDDEGFDTCDQIIVATIILVFQFLVGASGLPVNVTVDGPEPAPAPTPSTNPTPGPTPTPVTPRFTG